MNDADTEAIHDRGQRSDERAISFYGYDLGTRTGEGNRQRAQPGADLEEPLTRRRAGVSCDRSRDVRVRQEMLAEGLAGADAVPLGEIGQRAAGEGLTR